MPSIPQSLLWISLVVLWLFVLVPMLISKRDAVRRTSDVALATRVLNRGSGARLLKRGGPAAGHRSDPDWKPSEDEYDDLDDVEDESESPAKNSVVVVAAVVEHAEPDYLDVDVVEEDSGALPVGGSRNLDDRADVEIDDPATSPVAVQRVEAVVAEEIAVQSDAPIAQDPTETFTLEDLEEDPPEERGEDALPEQDEDGTEDEYEYMDDSSGLEAPADLEAEIAESPSAARRQRFESKTAAAVSARKYKFRKRVLSMMALILVASAAPAFTVAPAAWWVCGWAGVVTLLYLGYLRRQTRIEARLRRRRMQRMARSRLGVENTIDREFDVVPSRLGRPGAVVLEVDDEDPIFEHLDYAPSRLEYDLPRAAGQ
jgi:hypothetical protein